MAEITKTTALMSAVGEVFAPPVSARRQLPERVVKAIEKQENTSEILIKFIQIAIFGLWGLLYAFSPKPEGVTSLVPYVLVAYLVLNIIGLIWALRQCMPSWAIYVNVLIDMSMLMVLIWSFHIQYNQPPSFYLKAPTAFYIFIFIALRALRFQVRYVVAAGVVAIIGWAALTAYVIFSDPTNTMITRNYVEYLTSNSVLIGAEVDKVIAIIFVTGVLALVITRARKLLVQAVTEGAAAQDLSRFFDRSVVAQITDADQSAKSGDGVRRDAAIMFIDIRGFTPLAAKMDPSDAVCLLSEYQKHIVPTIQKHGGSIDKFLGDGIMASFGAVAPSQTYAADALRALDEIVAEMAHWQNDKKLKNIAGGKVNLAVAQGPVVFGVLGDDTRLEYTTIGDAVNVAAKLEKCNKVMGSLALTNQQTLQIARDQGYQLPNKINVLSKFIESVGEKLELAVLYKLPT